MVVKEWGILSYLLTKLYYKIYLSIFPDYPRELEKLVGNSKTLLDIGCGYNSPIKSFSHKIYSVGVDAYEDFIKMSKKEKIHNKYYLMNVLDIEKKFKPNSFDCVLASDLIEHLTKKDGFKVLDMMEKIAKKKNNCVYTKWFY